MWVQAHLSLAIAVAAAFVFGDGTAGVVNRAVSKPRPDPNAKSTAGVRGHATSLHMLDIIISKAM